MVEWAGVAARGVATTNYVGVPKNNDGLRFSFTVYAIQPESAPVDLTFSVGGQLVKSGSVTAAAACGGTAWVAEVTVGPQPESVTVQLVGSTRSGGSAGFVLTTFTASMVTLGEAKWTPGVATYDFGSDGWDMSTYGKTYCEVAGVVLGGINFLGNAGWLRKKFTDLPDHNAIRIQMK